MTDADARDRVPWLPGVPTPLRRAFLLAVAMAVVLPFLNLLAGKIDLQVARTPQAYLLRTGLIASAGTLVAAVLFYPMVRRLRWPRYLRGFLVLLYGLGAAKAGVDLWLDVFAGARTLAGTASAGTGVVAVIPAWPVDLLALAGNLAVLVGLLHPASAAHVRGNAAFGGP